MENQTERLYGEEIGSDYKTQPSGLGKVISIADILAQKRYPSYRKARSLGKYVTGEEKIPSASELARSAYKSRVEMPAKRKVREIFARGGKYALERFDERVIGNAVQDYINGASEIPFHEKERIVYEGKDVWGFQNGKKAEYLPAYKIRKNLGQRAEEIRKEVGLEGKQFDSALEHYVKIHELAEKRLQEYVGRLSEEQHGWLQSKVVNYLRSSSSEDFRKVGEVAYRIDSLRNDKFGEAIRKYRLAA